MPLYEYHAKVNGEIVARVTIPLAVKDRDGVQFTRCPIPARIAIAGSAEDPTDQANQVRRGCKRIEQRLGTTEMQRRFGDMPLSTVKRAWAHE